MRSVHRNVLADQLLDVFQEGKLLAVHQRPSNSAVARTSGTSNAVHVRFRNVGNFKIDHVRQLVNVDAACRNVCGHQNARGAVLEVAQRILAGRLALVAVNGLGGDAVVRQILNHLVRAVLGAGKYQYGRHFGRHIFQQMAQQEALAFLVHLVNHLAHFFCGRRYGSHGNAHRLVQQVVRQLHNFRRHGGREEHRLALGGQFGNYFFHVVNEAHVQHAVCLIQDKMGQMTQINVPLAHQVQQSAGGGGDQIRALAQSIYLGLLADAAKNYRMAQREVASVRGNAFVNLQGQFPCGGEDQDPDGPRSARFRNVHQVLQDGQREGCCFAGSSLCGSQKVATF